MIYRARADAIFFEGCQMCSSDKFPTSAVHCCAKWGEICNERRHLGYIDQLLIYTLRASNQVVGSSNLSGRAIFIRKVSCLAVAGFLFALAFVPMQP